MDQIQGYVLSCKQCGSMFVMCKRCYRGHRYCSVACRKLGYEQARKEARSRYDNSQEAKLDHRDRSKRYRKSQSQKTVTDKGSMFVASHLSSSPSSHLDFEKLPKIGFCSRCGRQVWGH